MRLYLLCCLSALAFWSCHASQEARFSEMETLLSTRPDSALCVLRALEPESLPSASLRARHALLTSMALDKNYLDVTDDSLINIAVDYYSRKGPERERMLAWYYQGRVYENAKNYIASAICYEKAEKMAERRQDWHYFGLINRSKAGIFTAMGNVSASTEYLRKAVDAFYACDEERYALFAESSLAISCLNECNYVEARRLLDHALSSGSDPLLLAHCRASYARLLAEKGDSLDRALALYRSVDKAHYSSTDYGLYALLLHKTGAKDSVKYWLDEGYRVFADQGNRAVLQFYQAKIEQSRGDYANACEHVRHAAAVQDSTIRVYLQQSLDVALRDYYQQEARTQEALVLRQKTLLVSGSILFLLILLVGILLALQRKRARESAVKEQMASLLQQHRNALSNNAQLVGTLAFQSVLQVYNLSEAYYAARDADERKQVYDQIKQQVKDFRKDSALLSALEANLDQYCNGVMAKLKEQVPGIRKENRQLISLFFSGLPNELIAILMEKNSTDSLKTARSRFRKTIKDARAPDETLFLDMLSVKNKPTPGGGKVSPQSK